MALFDVDVRMFWSELDNGMTLYRIILVYFFMKIITPKLIAILLSNVFVWLPIAAFASTSVVKLPTELAAPTNSSVKRGFSVRVVQSPDYVPVQNSYLTAIRQLNGTLPDGFGALAPNIALPNPNTSDGAYILDTINFDYGNSDITIVDVGSEPIWTFPTQAFPGLNDPWVITDYFAVEVITYLLLPAGVHTFGVSTSIMNTDVNDDDAFQVFVGANPRDFFNLKVGEYTRTGPAQQAFVHNESVFKVEAPVAGLYPFRLVYWQHKFGATLTWHTINPSTGERILINDPSDPRAIKAFYQTSQPYANGPYVGEVKPYPGSAGIGSSTPIEMDIFDGQSKISTNSILLELNDKLITPQRITKIDNHIFIQYFPNVTRTNIENRVRLVYASSDNLRYTNSWQFSISLSKDSKTTVTGQWDFDRGDLSATVGFPLEYLDGPNGLTAVGTKFGTTGENDFGVIPWICGRPAKIMYVPGDLDRKVGYVMRHGISPNGGGAKVNQWTLLMDVMVANSGTWAASLLQINSLDNTDDGDLFWQDGNFGQGLDGYLGPNLFTPLTWHRMIIAYDEASNTPVATKFLDGKKVYDWTAYQELDHPRRALLPTAILFADGDQDERREFWVNSIQIRSGKMSDADMEAMGGPSADGIPMEIPPYGSSFKIKAEIIGNSIRLSWPCTEESVILETSPTLNNPVWTVLIFENQSNPVTIPLKGTQAFFRLRKQ